MAQFKESGLAELGLTMQEIADIPDDVILEMLEAEAKVEIEAQKASLRSKGLKDTGKLIDSIGAKQSEDSNGRPVIDVYPLGTHHTTSGARGKRRTVRNAEVGFIHEFGAPNKGIMGKQWMRIANERAADDVVSAALEVYDNYLKSKNL